MAMVCKALVLIIFPIQFPTEQPNTLPSFSYLLSYVGILNHSIIHKSQKTCHLNFLLPLCLFFSLPLFLILTHGCIIGFSSPLYLFSILTLSLHHLYANGFNFCISSLDTSPNLKSTYLTT